MESIAQFLPSKAPQDLFIDLARAIGVQAAPYVDPLEAAFSAQMEKLFPTAVHHFRGFMVAVESPLAAELPLMNPFHVALIAIAYLIVVFVGMQIMKNFNRFEVKTFSLLHNFCLVSISAYMCGGVLYEAWRANYGLFENVADHSPAGLPVSHQCCGFLISVILLPHFSCASFFPLSSLSFSTANGHSRKLSFYFFLFFYLGFGWGKTSEGDDGVERRCHYDDKTLIQMRGGSPETKEDSKNVLNQATTRTTQSETKTENGNSGTQEQESRKTLVRLWMDMPARHGALQIMGKERKRSDRKKKEKKRCTFSARTFFIQSLRSNATFALALAHAHAHAHTTVGHKKEIESTRRRFQSQGATNWYICRAKGIQAGRRHSGTYTGAHTEIHSDKGYFVKVLMWSDNEHPSPLSHIYQKIVPLK